MKENTRKALAHYHAARIIEEMLDSDQFDPDLARIGATYQDILDFDEDMRNIIFNLKLEATFFDPTLFTIERNNGETVYTLSTDNA